jgi:hypothetical protein
MTMAMNQMSQHCTTVKAYCRQCNNLLLFYSAADDNELARVFHARGDMEQAKRIRANACALKMPFPNL